MKNILILWFFLLGIVNSVFASDLQKEEFVSPNIKVGAKFCRDENTAYLRCYFVREFPEKGFANISFEIIPKEGHPFAGKVVGKIGTSYRQFLSDINREGERLVTIPALDVDAEYRGHGFGKAAVQTVVGIFQANSRKNLKFDRFWLTVGKYQDREVARALYKKVGFEITKDHGSIPYYDMELSRKVN